MMIIDQRAIDARNALNATADLLEPELQATMADYLGKKVWKISGYGGMTAAVAKRINAIELPDTYRLIITSHVSWITAELTYRYDRGDGTVNYIKETFQIARRDDDGVMTETDSPTYPAGRPQFTLAQVETTNKRAFELEQQARDLRRSVAYFNR